jgi:DNA polymerase III epsilon subunit family exonuclease
MIFVALDLETTGLSPETDTIIEIAAIRFEIDRDGDVFMMSRSEEHSQLIHPGRVLTQEVTMITGITPAMLEGKPDFASVRDKVREFIGDAVIVGHNVLFDIAMFASHGIDLSGNRVIDTFELSEIFSQDIESLNLGFLANRYGLIDPTEDEHRALTDTRVSIRLFLRYLWEVSRIAWAKKQIWDTLSTRDESHTLATLSHICHERKESETDISELFADLLDWESLSPISSNTPTLQHSNTLGTTLIETHGNPSEEIQIIHDAFRTHSHIALVTPGYKVASWMSGLLMENSIENMIAITPDKWCSIENMRELMMGDRILGRKELILTLKIAYWLTETNTGLLDEMKYYGDERNMLDIYRCRETECPIWRSLYESKIKTIPVLIVDAYHFTKQIPGRCTIIKDLPLLEDIVRRRSSEEVSFDRLSDTIESLTMSESRVHMADMISIIRDIYETIPDRPTGPLVSPPGAHGETYFVTQAMLWHRGHKWLVHASRTLENIWTTWKVENWANHPRKTALDIEYIDQCISHLMRYHNIWDTNTTVILSIHETKTKITFIPRSVAGMMRPLLDGSTSYGINISRPETSAFLMREYGLNTPTVQPSNYPTIQHLTHIQYHAGIVHPGSVILTTSLKHARDLGQDLRKIHGKNINILIQWLSGGKWKMFSTFSKNITKTILIGIIDTWRDEYDLWSVAQHIIIAKLPFDPPTDPYFLARTVGMSNNFSEYSEPIVAIRVNILIDRIRSSRYSGSIASADMRLRETEWGKRIEWELL